MIIQTITLFIITLLAYFIKGITGFGNTLVMNSLLSFFQENRFITPVDLLLSVPANIYWAWKNRQYIHFKTVIPLSIAVIIGNIPGILFLSTGPDHFLKVILGTVLVFIAIEMFLRKTANNHHSFHLSVLGLLGVISGVLMGLFGIGALLAAVINRFTENRNDYRGNLCFVFVIDNIFRCIGYWWRSMITWRILGIALLLLPAAGLGMWFSTKLDFHLSEVHIRRGILILLTISGILLMISNWQT